MHYHSTRNLALLLIFSLTFLMLQYPLSSKGNPLTNSKAPSDTSNLLGRWNITVDAEGKKVPAWLEVKLSGLKTLVGSFVGTEGSARPVSRIYFQNNTMSFSIPPQWEAEDKDLQVGGVLKGDSLIGVMAFSNGKKFQWAGTKAPALIRQAAPQWGNPLPLFDGKSLNGWTAGTDNQWVVESGVLSSPRSGSNLISTGKFDDFKLHIEFRYPGGSNSGVYLRGRYEVQIIDSRNQPPSDLLFGGVYGFLTPSEMAAKAAGEWQTMDITLIGRMITVVANGKTIIQNQAIPGTTGGALDSNEAAPGPIMLQGDHGPVEFRSIIITPAR